MACTIKVLQLLFTIVIYNCNDCTIEWPKTNYDPKALGSVVNRDRKCDATIWSLPYDHNLQLYNFYSTGHR